MTRTCPHGRQPFPWKQAMGFGMGVLRLSPDAFWKMTPRELAAATALFAEPGSFGRAGFSQLMAAYPDLNQNISGGRAASQLAPLTDSSDS